MVATMVEHYDDDNVETRARLALVRKEFRRRENLDDAVAAQEEAMAKAKVKAKAVVGTIERFARVVSVVAMQCE
jgi:hypothetical protein